MQECTYEEIANLSDRLLGRGQKDHKRFEGNDAKGSFFLHRETLKNLFVVYAYQNFSAERVYTYKNFPEEEEADEIEASEISIKTMKCLVDLSRIVAYSKNYYMSEYEENDTNTKKRKVQRIYESKDDMEKRKTQQKCIEQAYTLFPWMKILNDDTDQSMRLANFLNIESYRKNKANPSVQSDWHYDYVTRPQALSLVCVFCEKDVKCGMRICKNKHANVWPRLPNQNPRTPAMYLNPKDEGVDLNKLEEKCTVLSASKIHLLKLGRQGGLLHRGPISKETGDIRLIITLDEDHKNEDEEILNIFDEVSGYFDMIGCDMRKEHIEPLCDQIQGIAHELAKANKDHEYAWLTERRELAFL